jgi:hypothetical protein
LYIVAKKKALFTVSKLQIANKLGLPAKKNMTGAAKKYTRTIPCYRAVA